MEFVHRNLKNKVAYKKIISFNKIIDLKNLDKFLYIVKGKQEYEVTKTLQDLDEMRGGIVNRYYYVCVYKHR